MTDSIRAEARAVEAGFHAIRRPDGTYRVRCSGSCKEGHAHHIIEVEWRPEAERCIKLMCDCPAGRFRPSAPVPCMHAATVGRRLEREGWAFWMNGFWYPSDKAVEHMNLKRTVYQARGACRICGEIVTVHFTDETPDLNELASRHREGCHERFLKKRSEETEVDLWAK